MVCKLLLSGLALSCLSATVMADEPVGKRPYEMVWADRTEDTRPALVDFEDLKGWTVECKDAVATFTASRQEQLWGKSVGRLVYRRDGSSPMVTVKPPQPVPVTGAFDCINFWVHGNNWGWVSDPSTPQVQIYLVFGTDEAAQVRVPMGNVRWKEWWLMHRRLSPEQLAGLQGNVALEAIEIAGGRNEEDRVLHFDNLSVYVEELPPLKFDPRPKRNLTLPEGQTTGTNTGPGRLPFPTREETILPDNLAAGFEVSLEKTDDGFAFTYAGDDGRLVYRYRPVTGTLGDVTARWNDGAEFQPMAEGGVYFWTDDGPTGLAPEKIEPAGCRRMGDTIESRWRSARGDRTCEVTYTFRLWQKSLVVDVKCPGGQVGEVRFGKAVGVKNPRLATLPYLTCGQQRPAVLIADKAEERGQEPFFVFGLVDYYRSNASALWGANSVSEEGTTYNGGARYLPKTDGTRNDCFERLFLTVSPKFDEVLPNVPNPKSPWMHVTGERVWRAHGASNREYDLAYWKEVARYGMNKVAITDHETGWRDGGESFTFRTRAAPGKGGDEAQAEYARNIRGLGFRYGIYNNYTDFSPVNEHWNEDLVTRLSNGELQTAWPRCYNPKPSRAVEFESRLAPIIQEKFHLDTAYCDVHTAVRPWSYCDFDVRVPGAGTFAATYYAYGEIMLHQKKTWNGPVYSEGNNHWYYCGLTDGNYGQDQVAGLDVNPWLVDFDLRKLHPLCCNFGMGNPGMFYGRKNRLGRTPEDREARLDRFLAATLAFGHTGFLVREGGMPSTVRSYFNLQQVHAAYARQTVERIRYADADGKLLDTSAAVASGAYKRSQIETRYSNGLTVTVNGHQSDTWKTSEVELPPGGWYVQGGDDVPLAAFSAIVDGHRVDYVDSPAYIYADGRGRFTRFEKAVADGQLIAHRRADGSLEVIPVGECSRFGVSLDGKTATAVALDKEGNRVGPAETRLSRGLVYVTPVADAFSYELQPGPPPKSVLRCDRTEVVPGETVIVAGKTEHKFRIPPDAVFGERLWHELDGGWIDFTVVPLVDATLAVDEKLRLELVPHPPRAVDAELTLGDRSQNVRLVPGEEVRLEFPWDLPKTEDVRMVPLKISAGPLAFERKWWVKTEAEIVGIAPFPTVMESGECHRGSPEVPMTGKTGAIAHRTERSCGDVSKTCLFMHPPYMGATGYSFALFDEIVLPGQPKAALRCQIGKADGSDPGDGVLFKVAVVEADGTETVLAEKQWIEHAWTPLEADLSRFAGEPIRIKLITDVGNADNSSGDWACWAGMSLESLGPTLVPTVHDEPVRLAREPGPFQLEGLTLEEVRKATSAVLHFSGIGLQCGGQYRSQASLNGIPLGDLPSAGGNEKEGEWAEAQMALTGEAIKSLGKQNRLSVHNPGEDYFKIGRVWIEVKLPDGRSASSQITNTVYTQPPTWPYCEGIGIPFGQDIAVEIRWDRLTEKK